MDYAQGALSYIMGPGLVPQILLVVVLMLVVNVVISVCELIVNTLLRMSRMTTDLFPKTYTSASAVSQNPNTNPESLIYNSTDEPSGMSFTYSMWIFIDPKTFSSGRSQTCSAGSNVTTNTLKHIFHKGSKAGFPLMAPAVFVKGNSNTLRIYMNSSMAWNNFVEVPNIPVGKWFHLVIVQRGQNMDVFVNGNIAIREQFTSVPKLNIGDVYILQEMKFLPADHVGMQLGDFAVDGAAVGMVSRIKYFAFAGTYAQIDQLYREGPSKQIVSQSYSQQPPYFYDDWWVSRY